MHETRLLVCTQAVGNVTLNEQNSGLQRGIHETTRLCVIVFRSGRGHHSLRLTNDTAKDNVKSSMWRPLRVGRTEIVARDKAVSPQIRTGRPTYIF